MKKFSCGQLSYANKKIKTKKFAKRLNCKLVQVLSNKMLEKRKIQTNQKIICNNPKIENKIVINMENNNINRFFES